MVCWFFLFSVHFRLWQTVEETLHTLRGIHSCEHVHSPMVNLDESPEDLWRSVLLQQICQSSGVNGGNVPTCVQDGLASHSGTNDRSRFRVSSKYVFQVDLVMGSFFFFFWFSFQITLVHPCNCCAEI